MCMYVNEKHSGKCKDNILWLEKIYQDKHLASERLPLSHLQGYVCSKNHHKKVAAQGKKNGGGEQLFLALSSDVTSECY